MGAEIIAGETIPAETGLNAVAVNFKKGCYPGQELVERMDSRAAVAPRSLRRLDVADGAAAGDPIVDADGNEVGVLTTVSGNAGARLREAELRRRRARHALVSAARSRRSSGSLRSTANSGA